MPHVFTYGTLEIPEVMEAVTGRVFSSVEATGKGFVRYMIQGRVYPGIKPAQGKTTSGRVYYGVDSTTLDILDEFEDEIYCRQLISVETLEGERFEAFAYIIPPEHFGVLTSKLWCRDHFVNNDLSRYVMACRDFYRKVTSPQ